ncbi:MAG: hypothetical protein IPL70_17090 [Uliginosibacterium sp.]|nr:hypothetical protein [Uliginosibacterium sp.]
MKFVDRMLYSFNEKLTAAAALFCVIFGVLSSWECVTAEMAKMPCRQSDRAFGVRAVRAD